MSNHQHFMKRGDTLPAFVVDLFDGAGSAVPISDGAFKFIMKDAAGTVVVNRAGTVQSVTEGADTYTRFTLEWLSSETLVAGIFAAEVQITYASSGKRLTIPNSDGSEEDEPQFFEVVISGDLAD